MTLDVTSKDALNDGANLLTLLANRLDSSKVDKVQSPPLTDTGSVDLGIEEDKTLDQLQASPQGKAIGFTPVELDSTGLPHDLRIHGKARKRTQKDDVWVKIRGIDPELVVKVEAELRAAMIAKPPVATQQSENVVMLNQVNAEHDAAAPPPAVETTPAPPPPAVEVETLYRHGGKTFTEKQLQDAKWTDAQIGSLEVVNQHNDNVITFPEFMAKVSKAIADGQLTMDVVDAAHNAQGLASRPLLAARPDLVPVIDKALFG